MLTGFGTVAGPISDAGSVTAATGKLGIGGTATGAGTLSAASGAVLVLKGGGSFTGALTGAGKIQIDSALTVNAGTSLSASSVLDNANVTPCTGAAITNAATHTYTIAAASGTTITVGGAGTLHQRRHSRRNGCRNDQYRSTCTTRRQPNSPTPATNSRSWTAPRPSPP